MRREKEKGSKKKLATRGMTLKIWPNLIRRLIRELGFLLKREPWQVLDFFFLLLDLACFSRCWKWRVCVLLTIYVYVLLIENYGINWKVIIFSLDGSLSLFLPPPPFLSLYTYLSLSSSHTFSACMNMFSGYECVCMNVYVYLCEYAVSRTRMSISVPFIPQFSENDGNRYRLLHFNIFSLCTWKEARVRRIEIA